MNFKIQDYQATGEEKQTYIYLKSLKNKGIIEKITFQPKPFILNKEVVNKYESNKYKKLIRKHHYTTDFEIIWNKKYKKELNDLSEKKLQTSNFFYCQLINDKLTTFLEVKPIYDRFNTIRMFRTYIQPIVYDKYNVFVQLFQPKIDIKQIKNFK